MPAAFLFGATFVGLNFPNVREERNNRSHGRMARQKKQGSESVDEQP